MRISDWSSDVCSSDLIVLIRQRPGKGNAIFITIEDETGITNIVLWARQFERYRRAIMASRLMLAEGRVQKSREGVVHLMASRIIDRTDLPDHLSNTACAPVGPTALSPHPRTVPIGPSTRGFHCSTS